MTSDTDRPACADATDTDRSLFVRPGSRDEAMHLAERYCRHCPAFDWCSTQQARTSSPGVWAGRWWQASHTNYAKSRTVPIDLLTREAS